MPRQKMNRYERINQDARVMQGLQNPHELFPDMQNIVLELACGRGEYSVGLAQLFPEKFFVGIDSKGDRIAVGLNKVHELGLQNVRFVCGIIHHLDRWFRPDSVDEIWIVHPDPRPRDRDIKRRLTNPRFLKMYASVLKEGGLVRLKTDDKNLFDYSFQQFAAEGWELVSSTNDLASSDLLSQHHGVQTHYERLALQEGKTINYGIWRNKKTPDSPE